MYITKAATTVYADRRHYTSQVQQHAWRSLHDTVNVWRQAQAKGDWPAVDLFHVPIAWLTQCVAINATVDDLLPLVEYCRIVGSHTL